MKFKIFITTVILGMSFNVQANSHEMCKNFSQASEKLMEMRQNGFPMRKLMDEIKGDTKQSIIKAAYQIPRYQTEKNQKQAIEKFSNRIYKECSRIS